MCVPSAHVSSRMERKQGGEKKRKRKFFWQKIFPTFVMHKVST